MQVKIEDISHSGSGVGKIDGKVIFVPHTDIGEIVEIKNIKKGSKFDKAEVAKVLTPSKDRCVPFCPYFSICGGCDFQFVNYERELKLKELILKNELKKVNFFEKIDIFSSKNRFFYRNKIKLSYFEGKLGYYSADKNFVEVEYCPLAEKEIDYAIKVVKEYLKVYKYQNLKSVTFRKTDEIILISFLFSKKEKLKYSKLLDNFIVATFIGNILESDKTKLFERFNFKGTYKTILNEKIPADFNSFFQVNDEVVSSTLIRKLLKEGRVNEANKLLKSPFVLEGVVIEGAHLGRTIGFPTANVRYPKEIVRIPFGVYAVRVGEKNAVLNWGMKPTVHNTLEPILEAHILDFSGDIYGNKIRIEFIKRIREERKFSSLSELQAQIRKDILLCSE